ncbi:MAG: tetratricopeptide repeat protein, partial [Pseudomonadales bacterium]|nr:tetratricopeptide repeat protein [Pseudomonadales bacterium]
MKFQIFIVISLLVSILSACDGAEGRKQKYMEQATSSFSDADYEKARVGYQNVLKIDPKDVPALLGFAETLEKLQDWRGAVGRYRAVLELQPDNVKAKIKLGQLYLLANEVELASSMAEDVLAKDSAHPGGLTLKAGVLSKLGKLEEARSIVEQSYKIDSSSMDSIVLLASLHELSKDRVAAVALIEAELINHPDSITLHTLLSKLYLADEKFVLAEQELLKLTQLAPENINLKKQLVLFYEKTERPDKAEAVFRDIIASDEGKTQAVIGLHELYVSRGDKEGAEALLKEH